MQKMLIVDDDSQLRALVKTYAEVEGFHCREAANGKQALEAAQADTFDIIVLDVMMPEMDGFEALSKLREFTEASIRLRYAEYRHLQSL